MNTTMLPAQTGTVERVLDVAPALEADRRGSVRKGAIPVRAGHHGDATVVERGVGDRDPAGQVRLGLDERIAVVLMPEDRLGRVGLLVDRLIPIEAHVGTEEIAPIPASGGRAHTRRRTSECMTRCGATVCVSIPATLKRPRG